MPVQPEEGLRVDSKARPIQAARQHIPDRIVFDKLLCVLVFGSGYEHIAYTTCRYNNSGSTSATLGLLRHHGGKITKRNPLASRYAALRHAMLPRLHWHQATRDDAP